MLKNRVATYSIVAVALLSVFVGLFIYQQLHSQNKYTIPVNQLNLLSEVTVDKSRIKISNSGFTYNQVISSKNSVSEEVVSSQDDSSGDIPYTATIPINLEDGIQFGSSNDSRGIVIKKQGKTAVGRLDDGRVIYPVSSNEKHVYSFKRNGLKEDIILAKPSAKEQKFSWELQVGAELEARVLGDGSIGIYSNNGYLFDNNLTVSDQKSQELIDNAKKNGKKDDLVFVLPKPYIVEADGQENYDDVSFSLEAGILTLTAKNLDKQNYPISIDPSIVVTTSSELGSGNDAGLLDRSISGQVSRSNISIGTIGNYVQNTNYISTPRDASSVVAYNGYIYVVGGQLGSASTSCKSPAASGLNCNDVQYASINADGSIGTFTTSGNYFLYPRMGHFATAYNGFLYVIGGREQSSDTNCKNSGTSNRCNDIQYASINPSDGSIGSFSTNSTYFSYPRYFHSGAVYKGYLYIFGGEEATTSTGGCKNTGVSDNECNDTQYAPINADGTIGSFTTTSYFSYPRRALSGLAYNGYLYIAGGIGNISSTSCKNSGTNTYCNDIQYAVIKSDGSIGTYTNASYFNYPRRGHSLVAHEGYMYVIAGVEYTSDTNCKNSGTSNYCNDTQYAPINADGSLGSFSTSSKYLDVPVTQHSVVTYNGYIYVIAGDAGNGTPTTNCKSSGSDVKCTEVQYSPIDSGTVSGFGSTGSFSTNSNYFNYPRRRFATMAYNGYLYIVGGEQATSDTNCKGPGTLTASIKCNDIQYASINSDGTVGTFTANTNYFDIPRSDHTALIYNGYMYVMGGYQNNSDTNCKNSGTSNYCNDVQVAAVNSNGSVGTFSTTNYFVAPRWGHASVAYKGYLYINGGLKNASDTDCRDSGSGAGTRCNDVQYAQINSNGSIGNFATSTNYFLVPRNRHTTVAYNGYLYVIAGYRGTWSTDCKDSGNDPFCNDIQYAKINYDGSIGSFTTNANYIISERNEHASFAFNGYLYVVGGYKQNSDTTCRSSGSDYFCQDAQYGLISSDGSVGAFSTSTNYFSIPRYGQGSVVYNGILYVVGGNEFTSSTSCKNSGTSTLCNDIQYAGMKTPDQKVIYERVIDTGSSANTLNSFTINGEAGCFYNVSYKTAASTSYGSLTTLPSVKTGVSYNITEASKRYLLLLISLDDSSCGGISKIRDITVVYNATVSAPTLLLPANGATGVSVLPEFRLGTTDDAGYYVRYKIEVCSTSNCSVVVRTIDQTASQTGWLSQDTQSATAYSSGSSITQVAVHTYQPSALTASTQYWWRAYGIDPGGTNTLSSASSISTFTTGSATPSQVQINGGTTIKGGTNF